MDYTQVRPFNQSLAGTVAGDCLENVRKGFSIASSTIYPNATASWSKGQVQHADRNIPGGLAVPLYYSYTVSEVDQGHVNVQLPNGTVWSDGTVYASLNAYLAGHLPKYLGWGENVNGVKVIQGEVMADLWNDGDTINLLKAAGMTQEAAEAQAANFVGFFGGEQGKDFKTAMYDIINSPQWAFAMALAYPGGSLVTLPAGNYTVKA